MGAGTCLYEKTAIGRYAQVTAMPQQSPTAGTRQTPRQCWRGSVSRGRSWLQSRGGKSQRAAAETVSAS